MNKSLLLALGILASSPTALPVSAQTVPITLAQSQDAEFYFKRGEEQQEKEDYKTAISSYTKAIRLDPKLFTSLLSTGAGQG